MIKKAILLIILLFYIVPTSWAIPKVDEILAAIDKRYEMENDLTARVKITYKDAEQGIKVMESIYYRRDEDDSFLIIMIAPDSEKGNGYLRVGDNMWMYRRNTRTFQHINRDENIGGSDFNTGDAESRKYSELYEPVKDEKGKEIITEEKIGNIQVYKIELKAKVNDVEYPKQIIWVSKENYLILKLEAYSLSGTLMETGYYKKYAKISDSYIPGWMMFIDEFEEGNKTLVELSGISLKKIDKSKFTKAYLENLSK